MQIAEQPPKMHIRSPQTAFWAIIKWLWEVGWDKTRKNPANVNTCPGQSTCPMVLWGIRDFTDMIPSARAEALGITNEECHCVNKCLPDNR